MSPPSHCYAFPRTIPPMISRHAATGEQQRHFLLRTFASIADAYRPYALRCRQAHASTLMPSHEDFIPPRSNEMARRRHEPVSGDFSTIPASHGTADFLQIPGCHHHQVRLIVFGTCSTQHRSTEAEGYRWHDFNVNTPSRHHHPPPPTTPPPPPPAYTSAFHRAHVYLSPAYGKSTVPLLLCFSPSVTACHASPCTTRISSSSFMRIAQR